MSRVLSRPCQHKLTLSSDGKTPDELVKQILQIHAILPGQKPQRQFNIPVRSSTQQSSVEPIDRESAPQQQTPQQATPPDANSPQNTVQQTAPNDSVQPTPFQPAPVPASQNPQEGVGQPISAGGAAHLEPTRSVAKNTFPTDPANPSVVPMGKPRSQPDVISNSTKAKLDAELPPSKLLNSNPAKEPHRDDMLRRKDSETHEDDEFVDAQS